jgi:Mg2+ and Co2+ transporter CorA
LEKHTYSRWIDYGTLYGMSRYSLVMLTGEYAPAFLIKHLQTLYYKMAELSLLQRATVVSFSDEVTHVSDLVHSDEDKAIEKIEDLYKHYILFVNKIYFREITTQEQGIEMYDMMQRIMRIPEQVKDLDDEIAELNSFAGMIADKKDNKENVRHTWIATFFLPFMLMSGFFGMNYFSGRKDISWASLIHVGEFLYLSVILLVLFFLVLRWDYLKKKKLHIPILMLLFWGILGAMFVYLN